MNDAAPEPSLDDDLVLLVQACNAAFGDRVLADVRAAAGRAVRFNDGYVFQHLVPGPMSITGLAARLGISQQAMSKQVADLEDRGLVVRRPDPADGRAKLVELSRKGRRAVEAGRTARQELATEIAELLGSRRTAALVSALREISGHTGAMEHLAARRLRPESDR